MSKNLILIAIGAIALSFSLSKDHPIDDAELLMEALNQKEGILSLNTSEEEVVKSFENLLDSLQYHRTHVSVFKDLSSTISNLNNGHTQLIPSKKVFKNWIYNYRCVPFDYHLHDSKLYVDTLDEKDLVMFKRRNYNVAKISKLPVSSQIISIGGETVDQMLFKMQKYVSSDENCSSFKLYQLSNSFEFYRTISNRPASEDSIQIEYILKKDTISAYFQLGIPPINSMNKRVGDFYKREKEAYKSIGKFEIMKSKYGYFRFKSFKECSGKKYEEFLKKSFEEIKKKNIDKVIVDLRGNTGGRMQFSIMRYFTGENIYLGKYQVNKPHKFFKNRKIKKINKEYYQHVVLSHKKIYGDKNQLKIYSGPIERELVYGGKVIVVTDEGTFSAASILAAHLKTHCQAKIVGRIAGGSFYSGNAGTTLY